jgi:peptidoglycan hydrolase-like protein with peptidoglycan-binding domain
MNEFKFQVVNIFLLVALVLGMYWAFTHIDNGVTYGSRDVVQGTLEDTDIASPQETDDTIFDASQDTGNTAEEDSRELEVSYEVPSTNLTAAEKTLISELEGLIEDNIFMKSGSRGTRVGTVQKFLNIYLDKKGSVDGDYGPGTLADVKKFQQAEGLGADGLAGPTTYAKMIEILEK